MPIIVKLNYEDGTNEIVRIPAEIWRENAETTYKGFLSSKPLKSIELDPHRETADANRDNNYFPPKFEPSRFKLYKAGKDRPSNPMREQKQREEAARQKEAAKAKAAEGESK